MHIAMIALGCLGAWLLVAGPLYQAALELGEQDFDHEGMQAAASSVEVPPRVSPWWWLLPPVAYVKQRRRSRAYRNAVMDALGTEQLEQAVNFMNKAHGWLTVAVGAFFIGVRETWELVELLEWPVAIFWVGIVVLPLLCVLSVIAQMFRTRSVLAKEEADADAARLRVGRRKGQSPAPGRRGPA